MHWRTDSRARLDPWRSPCRGGITTTELVQQRILHCWIAQKRPGSGSDRGRLWSLFALAPEVLLSPKAKKKAPTQTPGIASKAVGSHNVAMAMKTLPTRMAHLNVERPAATTMIILEFPPSWPEASPSKSPWNPSAKSHSRRPPSTLPQSELGMSPTRQPHTAA